ncbi:MAG: ribosome maturation factor RimM [Spirochaetaceae bacterium]|jgi:16S rRNA processing protein RimM|nr:ribosome maturation factor RimM [Spirochaetaceae bacterium]
MREEFVTAIVGQPFGLEGFVRIKSCSGSASHLIGKKTLTLRPPAGAYISANAARTYKVSESRTGGDGTLYLKFEGFDTPEAVKMLKGMEIVVPRGEAAALNKNEFYVEDLKGLSVVSKAGRHLGIISDILEGAGSIIEITLETGERRLVPFRGEFVGEVDVEGGRAVLLADWILE